MRTTAAQPTLSDADEPVKADAGAYTEVDRAADRELCQRFFCGWIRGFGNGTTPVIEGITFSEFQAGADRLAQPQT
jgi:hypothetical protein